MAPNPNEAYSLHSAMLSPERFFAAYHIESHMLESKKKPLFRGVHVPTNTPLVFKHVLKAEEWVYHFAIQYSSAHPNQYHPHIIQLYHVMQVPVNGVLIDGVVYYNGFLLAMEHAANEQPDLLHQHLSASGKAQCDMHKVFDQCASAMAQVHMCTQQPAMGMRVATKSVLSAVLPAGTLLPRLLHNDIKPDNFFLVAPQHVKLGDFGGADVVGRAPSTVTIRYCAPEQISGHSSVSSDWYGLAATMYCLVSGRHYRELRVFIVVDLLL
jgi:serine/threonine protein kinase